MRLRKASRLWAAVCLTAATAALGGVPGEPLNPLSGPAGLKIRVTAEIKEATVEEAAEKLGKTLGARIVLHDYLTGYSGDWVLDRTRRATLSWKNAPVGRVIRDFCRAYRCTLRHGSETLYALWPNVPPRAGLHSAGGYRFEVENANFRTPHGGSLDLAISVSADSGDGAALSRLEKIGVVGEDGRQVKARGTVDLSRSDYSDSRRAHVDFAWPHPVPKRLKSVEGVVRLYRTVRRVEVEVPFPRGEEQTKGQGGGVSVMLSGIQFRPSNPPQGPGGLNDPGGFRGSMKLAANPALAVELDRKPGFCEAVFDGGSRSLLDARHMAFNFETNNGLQVYRGHFWSQTGPTRRPVKVVVPLIVRSELGGSIPFRITDVAMEPRKPGR